MELCFIDTETTGLYPAYGDRICEIGLITADAELHIMDRFTNMINPLREISPEAQKVNKIEKWELESAPIFSELVEQISPLIEGRLLIGHNIMFDYGFLKNEFRLAEYEFPNLKLLDTRDIAGSLVAAQSLGLSALIAMFDITIEDRHRAMGDCRGTYELFGRLVELNSKKNNADIAQLIEQFSFKPDDVLKRLPLWLKDSLENQKEIEIEYCNRDNIHSRRVILPLAAFSDRGKVYLEAICRNKNAKRTFLIDRIKNVHYPE